MGADPAIVHPSLGKGKSNRGRALESLIAAPRFLARAGRLPQQTGAVVPRTPKFQRSYP